MTNHNEIENILADQNKRTGPIGKPVKDLSHVPADTAINIPIHDPDDYTPVEPQKTSIPKDQTAKDPGFIPADTAINIPRYPSDDYTPTSGGNTEEDPLPTEPLNATPLRQIFESPILWASLILFLSVFLIIILSELFQFIQSVQSAPFFLQIPAYIFIFILFAALSWSFIKLGVAYRQLRKSPQVRLDQIRDSLNRKIIRDQIEKNISEGFTALQIIVKEYPILDKKQIDLLQKSGMNQDGIRILAANIAYLLEEENVGKEKWIEDCDRLFVQVIDDCAKSLVKTYARQVALKTAIIPYGFLDAFTVAVNSVYVVEDLCRLYFVRGGKLQSIILALKVLFNVFIAAKIEDQIDYAGEKFFSSLKEICEASVGKIFSKVLGAVFKRTAEGAVNGFLFYRIGIATISMLRPIRSK
jgi:hypothetical protein